MAFTEGLCNSIQQSLNAIAGSNAPALKRDRIGAVDALVSDNNTAGFEAIQQSDQGKDRSVKIKYYQRQIDTLINSSCTADCTADEESTPFETILDVSNCLSTPGMIFNEDEMAKLCESESEWTAQIMFSHMNAMNVALDKAVLADYAANFGEFLDGTTLKQVKLFADTTNQPRTIAAAQIMQEYENAGGRGTPMIIGNNNLGLYAKEAQIGCCNDFGVNVGALPAEWQYYSDRFSTSIFANTEDFMVLEPGVSQLVRWNKYRGERAKSGATFAHGTLVDPFTGITYDLKTHYDDCADQWVMKLELNWELFTLPSNVYKAADDLFGVNGIFNFRDCSTLVACP